MNGQLIGRYSGTNSGVLVIDMDDMDTHYEGRVFAYDDTPSLPDAFAFIKTPTRPTPFNCRSTFCRLTLVQATRPLGNS